MRPCNNNIKELKILIEKMIELSERGDADREDTNCGIMYGVLRDAAFRLKQLADKEEKAHKLKGWWSED